MNNLTDRQILLSYMENYNIPKFYIDGELNDIKNDRNLIYDYYYQVIDRIEYALYSNTLPYPAFVLYNKNSLVAYNIESYSVELMLKDMLDMSNLIIEGEYYDEVIRIKDMLKLIKQGTFKIN